MYVRDSDLGHGGQLDAQSAVADVRYACELLLAPWNTGNR